MKDNGLALYHIDDKYISFLKNSGNKGVENNYANTDNQKPYVGVVVKVKGYDYFAPLSSPKEKYQRMSDSNPTLFKIEKSNKKMIGVVRLNNMIPVPKKSLHKLEFNKIKDSNYRNLIKDQYKIISTNADKVQSKAESIYDLVVNKRNEFYSNLSNDFSKLEKDCESYQLKQASNDDKKYSVTFEYDKHFSEANNAKYYGVYVNGDSALVAAKSDPNVSKVLDKVAEMKEFKDKGISAESLKIGLIKPAKLDNELTITRPDNLLLDCNGKKIQEAAKEKSFGLER